MNPHSQKHIGLLDDIYDYVGCSYLSDLKQPQLRHSVLNAVADLDLSGYSVQAWNKAIEYLTESTMQCETTEECRACLLAFLEDEVDKNRKNERQ